MSDSSVADPGAVQPPLAVVILAAGQGTRMRSTTPKVLHHIAGLPMIAHVLGTAAALQPQHLLVVVRHDRDAVAAAVAEVSPNAVLVDQDEIPGTGRAVEVAVAAIDGFAGDVLVLNGDLPLLDTATVASLLAAHRASAAHATLLTARFTDPTGGGRMVRDASGALTRIVEQRDATDAELLIDEVNAGVYVFRAHGLAARLAGLNSVNAQGERYLTDIVAALIAEGAAVGTLQTQDEWLVAGVNDRAQLSEVGRRMNAAIVRRWQLAGVTIKDPATTWIDASVVLADDVEVLPNTHLAGATVVARDAVIGPDTHLVDCEIGEGARVSRTEGTLAVVGAHASVGPFAYLRPGTELGADGKIGTFVETKNAKIGDGTKVPHLSYVGDTTVGEGSNIGAGTITANYDGVNKHATVVGSHVRTGAHNVFVAPVRIGDGAYTGAGVVVRKHVPAGSLAVSVAPQRNIEGWVAAKRPGTDAAAAAAADPSEANASAATPDAESRPE